MTPVVLLMGPTASGKSKLAERLVQRLPLEIISVDSAMIYRGMDIGTAKPSAAELAVAPHRLIDIKDPAESYSVGEFVEDVKREIAEIEKAGKIPLLVGGTMLYFNALINGLADLPEADAELRERINKAAQQFGWPALHARLKQIDPVSYQQVKPNDTQRIQRALEVFELTGQPLSVFWQQQTPGLANPLINIAIAPPERKVLHQRIAERWQKMLDAGLITEVTALYNRGNLHRDLPSMRCVGYRQVWDYLAGELSPEALDEKAIVATRRLAKRQFTWLKRFTDAVWFDSEDPQLFEHVNALLQAKLLQH